MQGRGFCHTKNQNFQRERPILLRDDQILYGSSNNFLCFIIAEKSIDKIIRFTCLPVNGQPVNRRNSGSVANQKKTEER